MTDAVYVTADELRARLSDAGGVGSRTAAQLPDERLTPILADAVAEVVGRLHGAGLNVPAADSDTVPPILELIVTDVAAYSATLEFYGSQPLEDRDPVNLRYKRALELLEKIATGRTLVTGIGTTDGTADAGDPAAYDPTPALGLAVGWIEGTTWQRDPWGPGPGYPS